MTVLVDAKDAYRNHAHAVSNALILGDMEAVKAETNGGDGKDCGSWSVIWKEVPLATPIEHPKEGHYTDINIDDLLSNAVEAFSYQGRHVGVPFANSSVLFYYVSGISPSDEDDSNPAILGKRL